jgi:rhodanese-related sulfurtransferase
MKPLQRTLSIALVLLAVGCGSRGAASTEAPAEGTAAASAVKELEVTAVAALVSAHSATVLDANGAATRAQFGIVPGARLLTSSSRFDVATELPADKASTLIFYCANTECGASHSAAERAALAGYSDVNVMPAGIMGWKAAGQATEAVPRS